MLRTKDQHAISGVFSSSMSCFSSFCGIYENKASAPLELQLLPHRRFLLAEDIQLHFPEFF